MNELHTNPPALIRMPAVRTSKRILLMRREAAAAAAAAAVQQELPLATAEDLLQKMKVGMAGVRYNKKTGVVVWPVTTLHHQTRNADMKTGVYKDEHCSENGPVESTVLDTNKTATSTNVAIAGEKETAVHDANEAPEAISGFHDALNTAFVGRHVDLAEHVATAEDSKGAMLETTVAPRSDLVATTETKTVVLDTNNAAESNPVATAQIGSVMGAPSGSVKRSQSAKRIQELKDALVQQSGLVKEKRAMVAEMASKATEADATIELLTAALAEKSNLAEAWETKNEALTLAWEQSNGECSKLKSIVSEYEKEKEQRQIFWKKCRT